MSYIYVMVLNSSKPCKSTIMAECDLNAWLGSFNNEIEVRHLQLKETSPAEILQVLCKVGVSKMSIIILEDLPWIEIAPTLVLPKDLEIGIYLLSHWNKSLAIPERLEIIKK